MSEKKRARDIFFENTSKLLDGNKTHHDPVTIPDTCFLIEYQKCCEEDPEKDPIDWEGLRLVYPKNLEDEIEIHNEYIHSNGHREISNKLDRDIMKYGIPVSALFEENYSADISEEYGDVEEGLIKIYEDKIDQAAEEVFGEKKDEVSKTDKGIIAISMGIEDNDDLGLVLTEDKHIREIMEELREPGYVTPNSGYHKIDTMSYKEFEESF